MLSGLPYSSFQPHRPRPRPSAYVRRLPYTSSSEPTGLSHPASCELSFLKPNEGGKKRGRALVQLTDGRTGSFLPARRIQIQLGLRIYSPEDSDIWLVNVSLARLAVFDKGGLRSRTEGRLNRSSSSLVRNSPRRSILRPSFQTPRDTFRSSLTCYGSERA
jgi:hypothetical protein